MVRVRSRRGATRDLRRKKVNAKVAPKTARTNTRRKIAAVTEMVMGMLNAFRAASSLVYMLGGCLGHAEAGCLLVPRSFLRWDSLST